MDVLDRFSAPTATWFREAFRQPTEVQRRGWPLLADGAHALLLAPTGSGKTLAAFLSCIDALHAPSAQRPDGFSVVYVSPLKALVYDIERNLRAPLTGIAHTAARLGEEVRPVTVNMRTGDTSQKERRAMVRRPGDILVTTPESLYLMLGSSARDVLRHVQTVIVDEIHVMAGSKRGVHLALTLERLSALQEQGDPQRVGLSATQRPLSEVARYLGGGRSVEIVDTSEPPHIDLTITVPVPDMERPLPPAAPVSGGEGQRQEVGPVDDGGSRPGHGMWPVIYPELLALIRSHRSTIVFTNSRLLCERLAQRLNELAGEELVRAHHGSISHHQRRVVEEQLKAGSLPAIVATSSLELGIDMGAVDLVVLVESPGSVASGLQRIGRAGHGVGERSEGRIFPKYRADLVEAAVVAQHMEVGRVESTRVPRNCLDVLAQQMVAMVAMDEWSVEELQQVVVRAYPYQTLSRAQLVGVLDMLAGRYPSEAFAELSPRLTWDRASDQLTPRKGAKMLASLNAGTIPDRGQYAVYMVGDGPRLGELDEEMVYESRKGDHIILGASTWRIEDITRDRVVVSPAPGQPGRLPFWHGDRPGRPVELGRAVGAFLRGLVEGEVDAPHLDDHAITNLQAYVTEQAEATGKVPTDRQLVVECFRDELGDWRVCILTPLGARVLAPWALALESLYSDRGAYDVQALWTDDGICLRFADIEELPPLDDLFPDPEELEELVVQQLSGSALFASRFRENAARALLLPRRRPRGRTPLWQQRLRAQNLQQVAMGFPAFPIVLETYRECLQEAFDLPSLVELLGAVRSRAIAVHEVQTQRPSPFARSLVFAYVAAFMYAGDAPLAERRAQALTLDRELLRDLLGAEELRELLSPTALAQLEGELQRLLAERQARSADALHDMLRRVGELSAEEVADRCAESSAAWLDELVSARRVVAVRVAGIERFVAVEDVALYRDGLGVALPPGLPGVFVEPQERALERLVVRWAKTHGPFEEGPLAARWGLPVGAVQAVLSALADQGAVIRGELRPGGEGVEWCHPDVLRSLRRRSLAELRREVAPVEAEVYGRFLLSWHGIDGKRRGLGRLREVVAQLQGAALPASQLDALLMRRVDSYRPDDLDTLGAMGEVVWVGRGAVGTRDGRVALYPRDQVHLLFEVPSVDEAFFEGATGALRRKLLDHLEQRGASFSAALVGIAAPSSLADVVSALWDLAWAGLATNDTFAPLRQLRAKRRRRGQVPGAGGRWSATSELCLAPATDTERAYALATMLLERYGIATAAAAKADGIEGGFSAVYPVLKAMEDAGKVRRGWFVEGMEGAQFSLPGAVDRLRSHRFTDEAGATHASVGEDDPPGAPVVLPATDPANPYGVLLPWPASAGRPRRALGCEVVLVAGEARVFVERKGRAVIDLMPQREGFGRAVVAWARSGRRRRVEIHTIDGEAVQRHPRLAELIEAGFVESYPGLALP